MTIDAVRSGSTIVADWTVSDADSEDVNGNGILDLGLGEDRNENGVLDTPRAGVAFDWYRLAPGEDPSKMSDVQIASLFWRACTRDAAVGDTDAMVLAPGQPPQGGLVSGAEGAGRSYSFAWDSVHDAGRRPPGSSCARRRSTSTATTARRSTRARSSSSSRADAGSRDAARGVRCARREPGRAPV